MSQQISIESMRRQIEAAKRLAREARGAAYFLRGLIPYLDDQQEQTACEFSAAALEKLAEDFQDELRRDKSDD